jgi:hypothetical protein
MVKETEDRVQRIIHNLKEAQARKKSYTDKRRIPLYFLVGDYVYLKVSPMKGVSRFGVKGKLAPRYMDQWHTDFSYPKPCLQYIMCSTCLN